MLLQVQMFMKNTYVSQISYNLNLFVFCNKKVTDCVSERKHKHVLYGNFIDIESKTPSGILDLVSGE